MKILTEKDTEVFEKPGFKAIEYPLGDNDINIGRVTLNGRYPKKGFVINKDCKEIIHVLGGEGILFTEENQFPLTMGTTALILPMEKYYITGSNLEMFLPCTPAWTPDQQEIVAE